MFIPDGYVSLSGALEYVARMREPEAVETLTPDGFAFLARVDAALRPRIAPPAAPIRSIRAGPSLGPVRDLRPADPMPATTAQPSPEAKAEIEARLKLWGEARQKLAGARVNARADLVQALISGSVRAAAVREDGILVTMEAAAWRSLFSRPPMRDLRPFAEAIEGRTVPVGSKPNGAPAAWGQPIIAKADLAGWCGAPAETEPCERPQCWRGTAALQGETPTKAQGAILGGIASERRLERWLVEAMTAEPNNPVPKLEMRSRATQYPEISVSERGFERAWAAAVKVSKAVAWATPGRRKSSQ
ncbi:hypothetical protein [Falsiroseomonas sp. E2-1-a4]|uniref:hypothetical protein n=1 Tax=Falsiroseomonas sp. E2-1-a4 TaxID=3239299 RepID=UPI003F3D94CE